MIHTFKYDDLSDLLALSQQAGWEHTEADWAALLKTGTAFGHRDESGRAISSCVTTAFGSAMTALGMVIVREENRRLGLATALMRHVIKEVNRNPLVLCSGSSVEGFYERFGFRRVDQLSKLVGQPGVVIPDSGFSSKIDIHPMTAENFERMVALDAEVHGCDRRAMLSLRAEQAVSKTVMLKQGGGTLLGYGFGILQGEQMLVGPVVAFNRFTAQEIVRELIKGHDGSVRIDVMAQRRDLTEELLAAGFEEVEKQPIMLLGATALAGRRDHVFSPVSQALVS